MNFQLSEEQRMLRDALGGYLARHQGSNAPAADMAADATSGRQLWSALCELGVSSISLPADAGGFGGGPMDVTVVMREIGRALAITPFVGSAVIAGNVFKRCDGAAASEFMSAIADGSMIVAFAQNEGGTRFRLGSAATRAGVNKAGFRLSGTKSVVQSGPLATHFLATAVADGDDGVSLFLVAADTPGVSLQSYRAIDGHPMATVTFDQAEGVLVGTRSQALTLLEPAVDEAVLALCAEAVGIMEALIAQTTDYLAQRKQFGQTLVSFQALQHRLADMLIQYEQAESMLTMAAFAEQGSERGPAICAAKIQIDRSLRFISQQAVQLHGGMGITDELAIGRYFKRALVIQSSFGSEDDHFRRYERFIAA